MRHDDVFPLESVDEQIEQWTSLASSEATPPEFEVIPRLSRLYRADQQSVERVYARLAQRMTGHDACVQPASRPAEAIPPGPEARRSPGRGVAHISRRADSPWLAQVAAILVAALLVGSLLGTLSLIRSSRTNQIAGMQLATPPGLYFSRMDDVYRINALTRTVIWHTHLAGKVRFAGQLVIIRDTVYVTSGSTLWALEAANGSVRWSHAFASSGFRLSLDQGLLYVDPFFSDRTIYALNPQSGAITATYKAPQGGWAIPTVVDGILYYTLGSRLSAVRLPGEKPLWQQQVGPDALIKGFSVQDGIVYAQVMAGIGTSSGPFDLIDAFDTHSGNTLWQSPRGARLVGIAQKILYATTPGAMLAFDLHSHKLVWQQPFQQPFGVGQMLVASGVLYLDQYNSGSDHEGFVALSATTGKVLWQKTNHTGGGAILAGVHNGRVYGTFWTGQGAGTIYALDARRGSQLWTMPTGVTVLNWGGLAVA